MRRPGRLRREISVILAGSSSGLMVMVRILRPFSSLASTPLKKPLSARILATVSLTLECGRLTCVLLTATALRSRLSMSAIGSVEVRLVSFISLPTTLSYPWDFALGGVLPECDTADAEQAHVAARAAGDRVSVLAPGRAGIARQAGQALKIAGGFKLSPLGGVLFDHSAALGFTGQN